MTALHPPPGTVFIGSFYYVDDFYNYLSFAQQAEDGAFLFQNKALLQPHPPALVNLEWWLVGRISRLLGGGRLLLAYRVFALLCAFGFLAVTDRWLRRLGLGEAHRLPALLLVATGGGLGGILYTFAGRALHACLDLYAGLFPFLGLLGNPHFTAGTTLLLLGLLLYDSARGIRGFFRATAGATVLALVRPYDFVLLVAVRGFAVAWLDPPRRWLRALAPLPGLLPVVGYLYWLYYRDPAFAFYTQAPYVFPPLVDFAWALGPAVLLALPGALRPVPDEDARRARAHLLAWAAAGVLVPLLRPTHFSLQFLVGVGLPLLVLGALGLGRLRPALTLLAALAFSTTQVAALRLVLTPNASWLALRGDMQVVDALRRSCRSTDVVFAPPALGLYAYGLTACRAFVSHPIAPGFAQRLELVGRFASMSPPERLALLEAYDVSHVVLPGDAGDTPLAWLGPRSGFVRRAVVGGPPAMSLYVRAPRRRAPGTAEQ